MKKLLLCFLLGAPLCPVFAQTSGSFTLTDAVERVISEMPTRLAHLKGDLLANNPEAIDYASLLQLKGADNCTISVFNTPGDTTACWKADLPVIDDFDQAKKAYQETYDALHHARITRLHPGVVYKLEGGFHQADETKQTNSIEFTLDPAGEEFHKVRVQLLLSYTMPEWHLTVQVYEKPGELGMAEASDQ
ncbi:hypothetical protein [Dinghuibacter silviterrae]|uniref:Uncharacterized protein n=1 Tax=Dinghuibacter silviterrae TaxID=1539049 RepID=A0A4R8DS93_9BACT|nr:hypothetical protein [Dinghuibacter silviterrae]TDX00708.1 hypothetical protein EDB95_1734 [Dinghuibacter silviterrae]